MGYWYEFQGSLTVEPGRDSVAAKAIAMHFAEQARRYPDVGVALDQTGSREGERAESDVTAKDLKRLLGELFSCRVDGPLSGEDGDAAPRFAIGGESKSVLEDAAQLLAPCLRSLQIDCHGEDIQKWRIQLENGEVQSLGGEVVYPGERALLAAPRRRAPPHHPRSTTAATRLTVG